MKTKHIFIYIIAVITLISSCKKAEKEVVDMGYNYFPLKINSYSIYQVDSIVYNDYTSTIDTFHYQVKLVIDSIYLDNANRKSYWWKKYTKTDSTQWKFNTNYSITITNDRLESIEENMRYIKLIFPVITGSNWDYNSLNTNSESDTQYSDVDFETNILNNSYDSCARVSYEDDINLVKELFYEEIYARNIGMIYRKHTNKKDLITGLQGYSVVYKLVEHKK